MKIPQVCVNMQAASGIQDMNVMHLNSNQELQGYGISVTIFFIVHMQVATLNRFPEAECKHVKHGYDVTLTQSAVAATKNRLKPLVVVCMLSPSTQVFAASLNIDLILTTFRVYRGCDLDWEPHYHISSCRWTIEGISYPGHAFNILLPLAFRGWLVGWSRYHWPSNGETLLQLILTVRVSDQE